MPTDRDEAYLAQLRDYYQTYGVLPSHASIAQLLGLRAKSAVTSLARRLKAEHFLDTAPDGRRLIPGERFFERPLADSVRAGFPDPASQMQPEMQSIDRQLIRTPSRTLLLKVKGDSMIDAGLLEGDMLVVERGAPARAGDIVVAIVDNEFTVKYLELDEHGQFYLRPGNKAYPPIRPKDGLEVFGKVTGTYRSYR